MTILFQGEHRRVVLLSQSFEFNSMNETRAHISQAGATLTTLSDQEGPENFVLTDAEADVFVEAWQTYRAEQRAAKEREQQCEAQMIADAYAIVHKNPAIKIEEKKAYDDDGTLMPAWYVSAPMVGYNSGGYREWSYSPELLLDAVKEALATLSVSVQEGA